MKVSLNLIVLVAFYFNVAPGKCIIAYEAHLWGLNFEFWFPLDSAALDTPCPQLTPPWPVLSHPLQPARSQEAASQGSATGWGRGGAGALWETCSRAGRREMGNYLHASSPRTYKYALNGSNAVRKTNSLSFSS